jgi:uncharacterized membrane protein YeaQ/YmgE (transglycosylase-associated protein family)
MYMGIILWIVFGALVGWVASLVMNTNSQQGVILNIAIGVVGAFMGGELMSFFGGTAVTGFNVYSFFVALFGAVVLIALSKMFKSA